MFKKKEKNMHWMSSKEQIYLYSDMHTKITKKKWKENHLVKSGHQISKKKKKKKLEVYTA